jgi:diguanylate cyclase (GGDEF)-like protein
MLAAGNALYASDNAISRKVLRLIFYVVAAFTFLRAVIYVSVLLPGDFSIRAAPWLINWLTPIFMALLPVIGTTTFVLLCSDRLRRLSEIAASTDYLTGVANRRTLMEGGQERFSRASERGIGLTVAVLDLDNFKAINDTFGHDVGDKALIQVAGLLKQSTRKADIVARFGGEEFVVLMEGLLHDESLAAVERIRAAIEACAIYAGTDIVPVTISAGVAFTMPGDLNFDHVLRRADRVLYAAKRSGKNRVVAAARSSEEGPVDLVATA